MFGWFSVFFFGVTAVLFGQRMFLTAAGHNLGVCLVFYLCVLCVCTNAFFLFMRFCACYAHVYVCTCYAHVYVCTCSCGGKSAALKPGAPNFSKGAKIMAEVSDALVYTVSLPPSPCDGCTTTPLVVLVTSTHQVQFNNVLHTGKSRVNDVMCSAILERSG